MKKGRFNPILLILFIALGLITAAAFFASTLLGVVAACISVMAVAAGYLVSADRRRRFKAGLKAVATQKPRPALTDVFAPTPAALTDREGRVCWRNDAFAALIGEDGMWRDIFGLVPGLLAPDREKRVLVGTTEYVLDISAFDYENAQYTLYRLVPRDAGFDISRQYLGYTGVVCYISIDNVEQLSGSMGVADEITVLRDVYSVINRFADGLSAFLVQIDKYKFAVIMERRLLTEATRERFKLLEQLRAIKLPGGGSVTASVAVGAMQSLKESDEAARRGLELAKARGGDQAVINQDGKVTFMGARMSAVEQPSQVRIRLMSQTLRSLMEQCADLFIMGHDQGDMDSFGAALGIVACARSISKRAYIVLDRVNAGISALNEAVRACPEYRSVVITSAEASALMEERSMLLIVDTQIAELTEAPALIGQARVIGVIDHHLRGENGMSGLQFFCHEPWASSSSEMVCEIIRYFGEEVKVLPLEAEAMLAGITVDTKGFSFRTGERTFEAASYLRRLGADMISVRQLFQDDMETFQLRAGVVRDAKLPLPGIAISVVPEGSANGQLVAAQAADALLEIRGIKASFVLRAVEGGVTISGRSLGEINVQRILERMGGGGHATMAGAQIYDCTQDMVYDKLLAVITEETQEEKE